MGGDVGGDGGSALACTGEEPLGSGDPLGGVGTGGEGLTSGSQPASTMRQAIEVSSSAGGTGASAPRRAPTRVSIAASEKRAREIAAARRAPARARPPAARGTINQSINNERNAITTPR